jgi:hypothetical protein
MSWRRRLQELVLAGGAFAVAGCSGASRGGGGAPHGDGAGGTGGLGGAAGSGGTGGDVGGSGGNGNYGVPCGNANSDPCICGRGVGDPRCAARDACEAMGGRFFFDSLTDDGGTHPPHCELPDGGAPADGLSEAHAGDGADRADAPSDGRQGDGG